MPRMRSILLPNLRRFAKYLRRFKLTDPGKLMVTGLLLALATGSLTFNIPIYHLFTVLTTVLVVAFIVGFVFRPRVRITGRLPSKAGAGEPLSCRLTVANLSRLPAWDLSLGFFDLPAELKEIEPGKCLPHLGPSESTEFELRLLPRRRGLYELPRPRPFTTFPFNLFRSGPRRPGTAPLLVLPSFHSLSEVDVPVSARYQPGGIALTSHIGESPEYIGNRDYRPGDSMRRIDSRAWARLATPVVKEYREEYYCRIALVVDTFVPGRRRCPPEGFANLEAAVSLTASVADAMSRGEHIIDIFAAGPDLYVFRSGRHTAHLENVLEILACVEECRRNPFEVVAPALADELSNISSVVFVLLDWDRSREAMVRTAVETGCGVKVVLVRDKDPSHPPESAESWAGPIVRLTSEQVRKGGLERI